MSESIICNEKRCLICGRFEPLHRHHIFAGSRRKASEEHGCWIWLCPDHHNMSDSGIHFDPVLSLRAKAMAQKILENEHGWSRERFIQTFGRSYIDESLNSPH